MKIICIGKNYLKHVKEMQGKEAPKKPVFFLKPETAKLTDNHPFFYPDFSEDIHYETEVVLKISRVGKHIEKQFAHRYYDEISLGIDFTARDLQKQCKAKGFPWEIAKAFDNSAPFGDFVPKTDYPDINRMNFKLLKNGEEVQNGNTRDMIFDFDTIVSYVSQFFTLKIGDLIYTGTPEGVGPVKTGDRLEAFLEDKKMLDFEIK
jgi:2-keto-4-pentenoate hydratase/2-oxohepta-3-ene-1,7-dioic acid hydratase in catechol pathway